MVRESLLKEGTFKDSTEGGTVLARKGREEREERLLGGDKM